MFMFVLISMNIFSQNSDFYPESMLTTPCVSCQGTGTNIYYYPSRRPPMIIKCIYCSGSGKTYSGYYYNNCGGAAGLILRGTDYLMQNRYQEAYQLFKVVYDNKNLHNKGAEAAFWVGTCLELGFGVRQNKDKAYDFYLYSSGYNFNLAVETINRINRNGFFVANDESRNKFLANYNRYLQFQYIGNQMLMESNKEIERSIRETNEEIREIRRNEVKSCIYCNGLGHYSNPNEKYFNEGTYICRNCGKRQSYRYHHSCTCKKCGGTGYVKKW